MEHNPSAPDDSRTRSSEFDINDFGTELDNAQKLLSLGLHSPTLTKQIYKRLALQYLADARQEVKSQVAEEIEETAD